MATLTITAKEFPAVLRQRLEHDTALLRAAALDTAARVEAEAVSLTEVADKVDQGHYKNAWTHRALPNGAEVSNDSPHAAVIEHGRRPGRPGPPYAPILEWVERKLVGNGEVAPEDAKGVAYAIRQKIHDEGSEPHKILKRAMTNASRWWREAAVRLVRS
jgi:hypothetical protein